MPNYKKDKLLVLKALRDLLVETIGYENINPHDEEEVSNLILELSDKRRVRKFKRILKEYDVYLKQVFVEEKLKKQEQMYERSELQKNIKFNELNYD